MAGFDASFNGIYRIIVPVPLWSVELRLTEDGINQVWVRASTESNEGAERYISFRLCLPVWNLAIVIKGLELGPVLLVFKIVNNLRNVGFAETDEIVVIEAVIGNCAACGCRVYH